MSDYQKVSIDTLNGGAIKDLFDRELEAVLENIADRNTKPDAVREIRLVVKFKPDENRAQANSEVQCTSKLAPTKPHAGFVIFGLDGETPAAYTTDPKQQDLGFPSNITPMNGGN